MRSQTNNKNGNGNIGMTIFLFVLAITLLIFSIIQQSNSEKNQKKLANDISQQVTEKVKKDLQTSGYKDLKKLNIVNDFTSWTPDADMNNAKIAKEIIIEKGNISKGYIYVRVSINDSAFSGWESVYVKMNNIGGHLFRKDSLPVPQSTKTELLYSLDNVSYLSSTPYSENRIPEKADWLKLFKNNNKIEILTFISSLKPAMIEEISLYYDCSDNSDCLLTVQ